MILFAYMVKVDNIVCTIIMIYSKIYSIVKSIDDLLPYAFTQLTWQLTRVRILKLPRLKNRGWRDISDQRKPSLRAHLPLLPVMLLGRTVLLQFAASTDLN